MEAHDWIIILCKQIADWSITKCALASVVIAVLSNIAHIRILGPSQAMLICAYTVV